VDPDFLNDAAGAGDFVIVRRLHSDVNSPFSSPAIERPMNVIRVEADPGWNEINLGPFFAVNNRLLRDFPVFQSATKAVADSGSDVLSSPVQTVAGVNHRLNAYNDDALAITIADLANQRCAITIFGLKESAKAGGLRGDMFIVHNDMGYLESLLQSKLGSQSFSLNPDPAARAIAQAFMNVLPHYNTEGPVRRVFVYGTGDFVPKIVESCGSGNCEVVRRARQVEDLFALNTKLDLLSRNEVLKSGFAVVNGIPYNEETLAQLGSFSGDLDTWLDYHDSVSGLLANYRHTEATSWTSLANELTQGKQDVLILFAHSNGSADLFLGDRRVSLKDFEALPDREQQEQRTPRFAVLFSCNTGRDPLTKWTFSDWRNERQVDQLAQILVKKGFFDKVLAPNHAFGSDEGIRVLQSLLRGENRPLKMDGWVNWALAAKKRRSPEG
jgi:hypothetical protein